jgi:hypothetical protein
LECSILGAQAVWSAGSATASRSRGSGQRGTSTTSSCLSAHNSERRNPARQDLEVARSRRPRIVARLGIASSLRRAAPA